MVNIGIILGSTRTGRFADRPAAWLLEIASQRTDATFEIVDLRDYPLPFYDEPKSPLREPSQREEVQRWARKVGSLDGYIFVTGEYNHGIPAALKNALDYLYAAWYRKPASYVGYGNAGGARAIEQLRLNLIELQVAPIHGAVHITDYFAMVMHGKTFADFPRLAQAANLMLDELIWWAHALRAARTAT